MVTSREVEARYEYSSFQVALHWIVVVLVVVQWLLGLGMERVFEAREVGEEVLQMGPAYAHVILGVAILLVMILRLRERIRRPVETAAGSKHRLLAFLGRLNHWAFYIVLLALPPVGAIAWFGGSEAAGALHSFVAWALLVLIALHVGGALVHLALGENIIRRMVRPSAKGV